MDKLTQEFAQVKAHLTDKWLQCPKCQSYQIDQLKVQEISETLLECGHCNFIWRCISDIEQQDDLLWQHIVRGQRIVNHWLTRQNSERLD